MEYVMASRWSLMEHLELTDGLAGGGIAGIIARDVL